MDGSDHEPMVNFGLGGGPGSGRVGLDWHLSATLPLSEAGLSSPQ